MVNDAMGAVQNGSLAPGISSALMLRKLVLPSAK